MSFFQSLFNIEFLGNWVLADRQYSLTFPIKGNRNTSDWMTTYGKPPFDLSAGGVLTFNYAYDLDFKIYVPLLINVTGATPAATTVTEVVTALNGNSNFAEMFIASVNDNAVLVYSRPGRARQAVRVYISNTGAEQALRFNRYAPVSELPTYMARHTIDNRFNFPDSAGLLTQLDETNPFDPLIISEWGFDYSAMQADWQLLRGRGSGLFNFQKITLDGSQRVTQILEYPAGSTPGALAKVTKYVYSGANTQPSQITEQPHTLATGDLVTP